MKYIVIFLVLLPGIVMLAAGCSSPVAPSSPSTPVPSPPVTSSVTSPSLAVTSVQQTSVPLPVYTGRLAYTSDEINQHFIDLAFSSDNNNIRKYTSPLLSVAITGSYNDADIAALNRFFQVFNNYSSYTRLPSTVKQGDQGDIVIRLIPGNGLEGVNSDNTWKVYRDPATGTILYMFKTISYSTMSTDLVYINSDLTGNERTHWILRGLLYELGLPGETGTYPESIFYSIDNGVTELSPIDIKALQLLYGNKITKGMSLDDVRRVLVIRYR